MIEATGFNLIVERLEDVPEDIKKEFPGYCFVRILSQGWSCFDSEIYEGFSTEEGDYIIIADKELNRYSKELYHNGKEIFIISDNQVLGKIPKDFKGDVELQDGGIIEISLSRNQWMVIFNLLNSYLTDFKFSRAQDCNHEFWDDIQNSVEEIINKIKVWTHGD